MAQLHLAQQLLFFKVLYFGLSSQDNECSLRALTKVAQDSEQLLLLPPSHFFLSSFPLLSLPTKQQVKPCFELIPLSSETLFSAASLQELQEADGIVWVVSPKKSLIKENREAFQQLMSALNHIKRTLESLSFIIQYTSKQEPSFFELRDIEHQLNQDEFVSLSAYFEKKESFFHTFEEIASDLIDEFSLLQEEPDTHDLLQELLNQKQNFSFPSRPQIPFPSLPFYSDIPKETRDFTPSPLPFYSDLPHRLPHYGLPSSPSFPSYGDQRPSPPERPKNGQNNPSDSSFFGRGSTSF
jgi:hypothetical protein